MLLNVMYSVASISMGKNEHPYVKFFSPVCHYPLLDAVSNRRFVMKLAYTTTFKTLR